MGSTILERDDEKYFMYTDRWVERFMRLGLWDSMLPDNYELWLDNFEDDEQLTARYLIDGLVYYNKKDVASIISWCFDECIRKLCVRNMTSYSTDIINYDASIPKNWAAARDSILESLYVCPAFTDKPDASSYTVYRQLTTSNPLITNEMKCELSDINKLAKDNKCKTLILVDDIIGSGKQALKNWFKTDKYVNSVSEPLAKTAELYSLDCYLLVVAGCYDGLNRVQRKTKLQTITGEYIPSYMSVINPGFWPQDGVEHTLKVKSIANGKGIPFRGFNKKSWAIAFDHDIPNVSSPLYYFQSSNWNPLYKKPKKG